MEVRSCLVRVSDGLLSLTAERKKRRIISIMPERNQQSLEGACLMLYIKLILYEPLNLIIKQQLISSKAKINKIKSALISFVIQTNINNAMILRSALRRYGRVKGLLGMERNDSYFWKGQKKHKEKFHLDYEYFSNVPLDMRDQQLDRIINLPKSNLQLAKDIPFFPESEYWDYHGLKLMTHTWSPHTNTKPRAVVVFLHSLNGHTALCGQLARQLASAGIIITGFDFKNFGQSEGQRRGLLQSVDELISVSEQYIIKTKTKYPQLKVFLCGMSLGGAIAFNISIKNPRLTNGIIMLSPSIRQNKMHYPFLKKITLMLSLVMPYQQLLKSSARNGSKYRLDDYSKKDPYIYQGRIWAKTVQQILFSLGKTSKRFKELSSPYLLIQSGSDKLIDPFACLDLQKASPSADKTTVLIHGMWHAVWFDDHVYDVIKIVQEWLEQRI